MYFYKETNRCSSEFLYTSVKLTLRFASFPADVIANIHVAGLYPSLILGTPSIAYSINSLGEYYMLMLQKLLINMHNLIYIFSPRSTRSDRNIGCLLDRHISAHLPISEVAAEKFDIEALSLILQYLILKIKW